MINALFEQDPDWKNEWQDMPEFNQHKDVPYQKIIISFKNENDVKLFADLINQKITKKTKSIWFPFKQKDNRTIRAYVEEN